MAISYSSCFALGLKAVMLFWVVQQTHSFTWTNQPDNPTYVVEGVSSSPARLKWSWNLLNVESIVTIFVIRKKSGEGNQRGTEIASRTGDNTLQVKAGFKNDYRVEDTGTLVINKVTKADEDTLYTFLLTYSDGSGNANLAESPVLIKVHVPPKITMFPVEKTEQNLGTNVTLTCHATGDPQPNITWTKDDIPDRTFNVSGPVLHLVNLQMKDAGVYKCTAFNGYGSNATAVGVVSIQCSECDAKIVAITLTQAWKDAYRNKGSTEYKSLSTNVTSALWNVYTKSPKPLYRVVIDEFRSGSVEAIVELLFRKGTQDPLAPLRNEIVDGRLGDIPVKTELIVDPTTAPTVQTTEATTASVAPPTDPGKRSGLSDGAMWGIIGACIAVVVIVLLIVIVCCCKKKKGSRSGGGATKILPEGQQRVETHDSGMAKYSEQDGYRINRQHPGAGIGSPAYVEASQYAHVQKKQNLPPQGYPSLNYAELSHGNTNSRAPPPYNPNSTEYSEMKGKQGERGFELWC